MIMFPFTKKNRMSNTKNFSPGLIIGLIGVLIGFSSLFFEGSEGFGLRHAIFLIGWIVAFSGFLMNADFVSKKLRGIKKIELITMGLRMFSTKRHLSFLSLVSIGLIGLLILFFIAARLLGIVVQEIPFKIKNGYEYVDFSGHERIITYSGDQTDMKTIIEAKVVDYYLDSNVIFASRIPREIFTTAGGTVRTRLSGDCEYWAIDTESHTVKQIQKQDVKADLDCLE